MSSFGKFQTQEPLGRVALKWTCISVRNLWGKKGTSIPLPNNLISYVYDVYIYIDTNAVSGHTNPWHLPFNQSIIASFHPIQAAPVKILKFSNSFPTNTNKSIPSKNDKWFYQPVKTSHNPRKFIHSARWVSPSSSENFPEKSGEHWKKGF